MRKRSGAVAVKGKPDHLHLGCGLHAPEGWLNVDGSGQVVLAKHPWMRKLLVGLGVFSKKQAALPWSRTILRLNLSKGLPFPDGRFRAVYGSHLLEHLHYDAARALLRECRRVLAVGGVCRMVVPDLMAMVQRYLDAKEKGANDAADRFVGEMAFHPRSRKRGVAGLYDRLTSFHNHKWTYDQESLVALFREAGLSEVKPGRPLESRIERITEVENPERILSGEGIVVEGIKNGSGDKA